MSIPSPLGAMAAGRIQPQAPNPQFIAALGAGEWLTATTREVPFVCMDGRPPRKGTLSGPRSAGATVGLWAAAVLAGELPGTVEQFVSALAESGNPVGTHRSDTAHEGASGCGAADHMAEVFALIAAQPEAIRLFIDAWGYDPTQLDDAMLTVAETRRFEPGDQQVSAAAQHGECPVLSGAHQEQAVVANQRTGFTAGNPPQQTFHIDTWSFLPAAAATKSEDPARFAAALAAFNAGAVLLLSGPDMPYVQIS